MINTLTQVVSKGPQRLWLMIEINRNSQFITNLIDIVNGYKKVAIGKTDDYKIATADY